MLIEIWLDQFVFPRVCSQHLSVNGVSTNKIYSKRRAGKS